MAAASKNIDALKAREDAEVTYAALEGGVQVTVRENGVALTAEAETAEAAAGQVLELVKSVLG